MKPQSQYRITALLYHSKLRLWGWRDANQLRALAVLPKDLGLIPSTYVAVQNCDSSSRESGIFTHTYR